MKTRILPTISAGLFLVILAGESMPAPAPLAGFAKEIASFQAHPHDVQSLVFSPDGKSLVSGGREGRVKLWKVSNGKNILDIAAHFSDPRRGRLGIVEGVAFSPDGKILASCGDQEIKLWDVVTGKNRDSLEGVSSRVLLFSPDGKTLVTGNNRLDLEAKKTDPLMKNLKGYLVTLAFDPKGNLVIATASGRPSPPCIWLWDGSTGKQTVTCKGYEKDLMRLELSHDGKTLASAGHDQTVRLWNTTTGENTATFDKLPKRSSCGLTFSPDGKVLVLDYKGEHESITDPGHILLLEVPSGKILASLKGHQGVVLCLAFSPNGQLLASGDVKGIIKIWSLPARYKVE